MSERAGSQRRLSRVYVTQLGGFWSFSPEAWKAFVLDALARGGAYTLPERMLRRRPRTVRGHGPDAYSMRHDIWVVAPLDWDVEAWRFHLDELEAALAPTARTS